MAVFAAPAAAVELARFTVTTGITPPADAPPPPFRFGFTTGPDPHFPPGACVGCEPPVDGWLFDALVSASGQTFVADASDPDFAAVAARLADSTDDFLYLGFTAFGFSGLPEYGRLGGPLVGVDRIGLHIDSYRYDAGAAIQALLTATLTFDGAAPAIVPAPWSLALLALGLPFLRRVR